MPIETLLINGPARSGKSDLSRLIVAHALDRPAHYLRMKPARDGHTNELLPLNAADLAGIGDDWCTAHVVHYTPERVFEILPEALRTVRDGSPDLFAIIEADGDPALRHAYPYDYRVFVMAPPVDLYTVFRASHEAAKALKQVMEDTAAFASEIFGLFQGDGLDDSAGIIHHFPQRSHPSGPAIEVLDIHEPQLRQFLRSPIGVEIASRIQLQPDYHSIVEADVAVINTGLGATGDVVKECVKRIEKLLARVRHDARRYSVLYWGDIIDKHDPAHHQLLRRLRTLLTPEP